METTRLILGLLIPWFAGYQCLRLLEMRFNPEGQADRLRQMAYGFFLGYMALHLLLLSVTALLGSLLFWPPILCLLAIAVTCEIAYRRLAAVRPSSPPRTHAWTNSQRLLFGLLLCWALLHLALSAGEILLRTVYPWDAWLAWIYRAKAWFYSADIYPLATPIEWLSGEHSSPYAIAAADYPAFPSAIPLWAAISHGDWSETLINLPVLLCGIALAMGIYGQAREQGIQPVLALLAVYLFLSTPLIGTHLSLAGYADIWMAGFAGLGFIALIRAFANGDRWQMILALTMLFASTMVKNEGVIWFYAALTALLVTRLPGRTLLYLGAALAAVALLSWASGITALTVPGVGVVGLVEGKLHLPFAGSHELQFYNVTAAYLYSFFASGSWHLLWPIVIITTIGLAAMPGERFARVALAFVLCFILVQAFIFFFTEQGKWAVSYSALNRLPLQFTAALAFCVAACLQLQLTRLQQADGNSGRQIRYRAAPAVIAIVLLPAVIAALLAIFHPGSDAAPLQLKAAEMKVPVGSGNKENGSLRVTAYRGGQVILSSGQLSVEADKLPILEYHLQSAGARAPAFFWRTGDGSLHYQDLQQQGAGLLRLEANPNWQGSVSEIGLAVYGRGSDPALIESLTLRPHSTVTDLRIMWHDWLSFEPWSQRSINWLRGGRQHQLLPIPVVLGVALVLVALLYLIASLRRRTVGTAFVPLFICAIIAWQLLDLRWTGNRISQLQETLNYATERGQRNYLDSSNDRELEQLAREFQPPGAQQQSLRLLLVSDLENNEFRLLRSKYHLLPHGAVIISSAELLPTLAQGKFDGLVLIDGGRRGPDSVSASMIESLESKLGKSALRLESVNSAGRIYSLKLSEQP